ncbi:MULTISPECIES: ORF6N domain-containing protein [Sanguibacteroides]|uniref:DNA-binding protein n=1 Tax=Sanguibacteroides justesenii TaxID=1547597 RepID=A0A0C3R9X2_9PORP|nr:MULTISPECIES: ORF6N domain-containing protein [Sanguibacteroides]KIO46313.1 DNA-binding protein [Sanguibacteroides justesenii]KIO47560.1 DNA-binding protein [Sanguibacteroides justesenii]PXZ44376.1 ORF6N domain-containing protein [Sanguibacteroides justesenii]
MDQLQLIRSKIYEIRGQKVMLDFDLAEMYGTETKVLKQSVKRNIRRFPVDFMFKLTKEEFGTLRSQFVTSNKRGGIRYLPFAFTESGVAMLSSILNSEVAIEININIMRAFIAVRQVLYSPPGDKIEVLENRIKELKQYMEEVFMDQNDINEDTRIQLELINQTLSELQAKDRGLKERNRIGYILPDHEDKK